MSPLQRSIPNVEIFSTNGYEVTKLWPKDQHIYVCWHKNAALVTLAWIHPEIKKKTSKLLADAGQHRRDLSQYLGKHRRQQREGNASPIKHDHASRNTTEMPSIERLQLQDESLSSSSSPARRTRMKPTSESTTQPDGRGASARLSGSRGSGAAPLSGGIGKGRGQRARIKDRLCQQPVKTFKRKVTMNDLPTEVLLHVFSFLPPNDLLTCVCVNRQWMELASDNVLWQPLYECYASQSFSKASSSKASSAKRENSKASKPHPIYSLHADTKWKKACISECIEKRNSRIAALLKKKHPFSLLPANTEKTMQKLGLKWQLVLIDSSKTEHSFDHSDAFHFHSSSSVRWYTLDPPPLSSIRRLAIYALAPVFFDKDGLAAKNSPCQRSLLLEQKFQPSDFTKKTAIKGDAINIYTMDEGIILATWAEGGEIAFVSLCLHHNGIIQRSLYGTSDRMHIPATVKPRPDDIDSEYGLHDYSCVIELRNQRSSLWSQQFMRIHASKLDKVEGFIRLTPVRGDVVTDHSYTTKKIQFPWKTDVFKGIVKDLAILDCTVFDEFQHPMWCISSPVSVSSDETAPVTMEYDGDPFIIHYSDEQGKVGMRMFWIPDREQHIIVAVNIDIAVKTINDWFGTHYK